MKGGDKPARPLDLRLCLLLALTPRGVTYSVYEIAALVGCAKSTIWQIEQSALRKLRKGARARMLRAGL
jgi:DNA-directed RNA polymerase sigma subunit (sigma70/sigma32)